VSHLTKKFPKRLNYYFNVNTSLHHVDIDITNKIISCVRKVNILHKEGLLRGNYVSSAEQSSRIQNPRTTQ